MSETICDVADSSGKTECKNLKDGQGRPLRLYLVDGRPVTDKEGVPLRNIVGKPLITPVMRDGTTQYYDTRGCLVTDMHGRNCLKPGYSPIDFPPELEHKRRCKGPVFALDGHPLTDVNGVPMLSAQGKSLVIFNPKGHPVTDLEGRGITNSEGVILNPNERPYLSRDKIPLRIFDELGRPLTDENGFPLTNILGFPLVFNDVFSNSLRTLKGYPIKDADGKMDWEEGFDLTKFPRYNIIHKAIICKNKEHGIAFDMFGHPLTDMYGFPLFDLEGVALVRKRKVWIDVRKNPVNVIQKSVYDQDELKHLVNSKGRPVLIYDRRGYPLTDEEGTPLMNSIGILLLKFNEFGEPVSDYCGYPVFDSRGNSFGSIDFRPCKDFRTKTMRNIALSVKKRGFQYYDANGMPVTSCEGIPLLNSNQELMAVFDKHFIPIQDNYGRPVYDILGLPVNSYFDKPLIGPNGAPIRLYNKLGKPLTDRLGNVLRSVRNEPLLKLNEIGRIISDAKGDICYDADGCPMNVMDKFQPTKFPTNEVSGKSLHKIDGTPLILYALTGEPYTDSRGCILLDSKGCPFITYSQSGIIQESQGKFIFDEDGYTKLKVVGRALKDKIAIYDEYDRPLIGPSGFILRLITGKEIVRLDSHQRPVGTFEGRIVCDCKGNPLFTPIADVSIVPKYDEIIVLKGKIQLFDCEDRPLLDINGSLLYSSKGIPLIQFRENGKLRCDALGRPIFDKRGIPVCNPGGVWRDKAGRPFRLYDKESFPVTDPRGKELINIRGLSLLLEDDFGHPKYDSTGNVLCDAKGFYITAANFVGTTVPPKNKMCSLLDSDGVPLKLFDVNGRPLTDDCGMPLETSKGKPLLDTTKGANCITDSVGAPVYDLRKIPLGCCPSKPILTMEGKPIILYNKYRNPLMTSDGIPIKRWDGTTLLSFDQYGRPESADGSRLYDVHGNCVESPKCVLTGPPSQSSSVVIEGCAVKAYDRGGRPLTDDKGTLLIRSDGEPLKPSSWGDILG